MAIGFCLNQAWSTQASSALVHQSPVLQAEDTPMKLLALILSQVLTKEGPQTKESLQVLSTRPLPIKDLQTKVSA